MESQNVSLFKRKKRDRIIRVKRLSNLCQTGRIVFLRQKRRRCYKVKRAQRGVWEHSSAYVIMVFRVCAGAGCSVSVVRTSGREERCNPVSASALSLIQFTGGFKRH